jgi:hypothetical protein
MASCDSGVIELVMSVSKTPGTTVFTVMPRRAASRARERDNPNRPALAAPYPASTELPMRAVTKLTFTMRPNRCSIIGAEHA